MAEILTARCLCGGLRCEITTPSAASAHCHCTYCRRAHGAAFVTWLVVPEAQFRIAAGEELLQWYQSSEPSRRGFCATCGTTMLFASKLNPGEMHVAQALIEGDADRDPEIHCFPEQRMDWVKLDEGLPSVTAENELLLHYKKVPAAE